MQLLLHDRLNVIANQIGELGILNLLDQVKQSGVTNVGLNQHDNGGFWEDKYIHLVQRILVECYALNLTVTWFADDISKCDRGNPVGWPVELRQHTPQFDGGRIRNSSPDGNGNLHRVIHDVLLRERHLYQLHYKAFDESGQPVAVEPFFIFPLASAGGQGGGSADWQISKYGRSAEQRIEFIPIAGTDHYQLVFRADRPFTLRILNCRAVDDRTKALGELLEMDPDDQRYEYIGTRGPSGHFHSRSRDFSDPLFCKQQIAHTYTNLLKHYSPWLHNGTITELFIGGDELAACGDGYSWQDYYEEICRHELAATALGLKLSMWTRLGDYTFPNRTNSHVARSSVTPKEDLTWLGLCNTFIAIAWEERTTPEICRAAHSAFYSLKRAGIYLGQSNPQHFKDAGFTQTSAFWWPESGQSYADFPFDQLEQAARNLRMSIKNGKGKRGNEFDVTLEFQDGSKIGGDIRRPSKQMRQGVREWIIGLRNHNEETMTAKQILVALTKGPKSGNDLSNPAVMAKMLAVGWIKFDRAARLWSITPAGHDALYSMNNPKPRK